MEEKQIINCTVESSKYDNGQKQQCELKKIILTPVQGCGTKQPDESMCSSYKNVNKK